MKHHIEQTASGRRFHSICRLAVILFCMLTAAVLCCCGKKENKQDNPTTLKLIQEAEVSEIKSGPSRGTICIIGEILVFLGCFGYVFVTYYVQKKKEFEKNTETQSKEVAK